MRKFWLFLLVLLSLSLCVTAQAATMTFNTFSATVELSDDYILLTPENLAQHPEWLERHSVTLEDVLADWQARGVLVQAWSTEEDVCVEISAIQDAFASQYYDINEVTDNERGTFRLGHTNDKTGYYREQGYDYSSATWDRSHMTKAGRFLALEYRRTWNGETYRGYARKSIRNGYSICVDYQVHGRAFKSADKKELNAIMATWAFTEIFPRPAAQVSKLIFTETPPMETSTGKFTVAGTGSAGVHITAVATRMTSPDPVRYEMDVPKSGKFSFDVALPTEGYWIITYTVENAGESVEEGILNPITYQKTLLSVNLDGDLPETMQLTSNNYTISGTTMKGTTVQCIVGENYRKQITTNNSGKFSFKLDTSSEGVYDIALVFEKKGYASRRFTCKATRVFTEEDRREAVRDSAVKPAYSTLNKKLKEYTGRYMVYTLYVEQVRETSDGWLVIAGMRITRSGGILDKVVVEANAKPSFQPGDKVKMYLQCTGPYNIESADSTDTLPCFDLMFVEQ